MLYIGQIPVKNEKQRAHLLHTHLSQWTDLTGGNTAPLQEKEKRQASSQPIVSSAGPLSPWQRPAKSDAGQAESFK